ncbi:GntR family transcriptional regulator [Ottowia thiooxydans]|uniref:GntR family transcriptional regulator of vanillate catabolism n=1 Tax=Ottowia thiooxydans TaxID=219182 RepID=A0ABV2Q5X6_9BURK
MGSLIESVSAELRQLVLAGELAPDERVVELDLAARLNVSRTPLRLAFAELEREGLFERLPKRGFRVRRVTLDEVAQAIDVRGALEGLAARTAAEMGISAAVRQEFRTCVTEGRRLVDAAAAGNPLNSEEWIAMNIRFHRTLIVAANNPVLAATLAHVAKTPLAAPGAVALGGMQPELEFSFLSRAQSDHEDIVDSIEAREGVRAESLLREHARRSRDNKRRLIQAGVEFPNGGAAVVAAERAKASAPEKAFSATRWEGGMG